MSNWQKGDLALCVRCGSYPGWHTATPPNSGMILTVASVEVAPSHWGGAHVLRLIFENGPLNDDGERGWSSSRFVKVTPPKDMKLEEESIPQKQTA